MRPVLLLLLLLPGLAHAWNAAGHRLVAAIAWQQLSPPVQTLIANTLQHHPDLSRWQARAKSDTPAAIFAEAATWPDDIRGDPRFYDADRDAPTPPIPGLPDTARHRDWHYLDVDRSGRVVDGQLERRLNELTLLLAANSEPSRLAWALPWISHLVADLHQPLHVGHADDDGSTEFTVENPFNPRQPVTSLHRYWDDLPGPPWLRGKRLDAASARLLLEYPAPAASNVRLWREESHHLLGRVVYPDGAGAPLPIISEPFHRRAQTVAERRLVDAGYRLGWLLERSLGQRVSRETP